MKYIRRQEKGERDRDVSMTEISTCCSIAFLPTPVVEHIARILYTCVHAYTCVLYTSYQLCLFTISHMYCVCANPFLQSNRTDTLK